MNEETELPEAGEIDIADLYNELDVFAKTGDFNLAVGSSDMSKAEEDWLIHVDDAYAHWSGEDKAEADRQTSVILGVMRGRGLDTTDAAQVNAAIQGAHIMFKMIFWDISNNCNNPRDPIHHLGAGAVMPGLVARALQRGLR